MSAEDREDLPGGAPSEHVEVDGAGREPDGAAIGRRPRMLPKLVVAAVLLGILVVVTLPVFSTLQPAYYGRYPDLATRMHNWSASTHARVSCVECHVDPGARGFTDFTIASIPAFYSQLIDGPHETNLLGEPSSDACQKCHTGFRQVSPDGDLLIPHRAHVQVLGIECVACHKQLVHSVNDKGFNRPEMETCLECHDGTRASNACVDCHTRKHTPANHAEKTWLATHGSKSETIDCGECHSWTPADFCEDCHKKRPATHAGNWKAGHAGRAKTQSQGCYVCHDEKAFCGECH